MSLLLILLAEGFSLSLVVEDGTGKADADAFVDLSVFKTYCEARGYALGVITDTAIEQAIRRATTYISATIKWPGIRTFGRAQALALPRKGFSDVEGYPIGENEVPVEVRSATCEAAWAELQRPGALSPTLGGDLQVKVKQVGPLRKEYFSPQSGRERPVLTVIQDILAPLLRRDDGTANPLAGLAVRR